MSILLTANKFVIGNDINIFKLTIKVVIMPFCCTSHRTQTRWCLNSCFQNKISLTSKNNSKNKVFCEISSTVSVSLTTNSLQNISCAQRKKMKEICICISFF